MDELHAFWLIIRDGIYHIHPVPFAVIALALGLLSRSVVSAFFGAILASAIYIAFEAFIPTVTDGKTFAMPHFNHAFWYAAMALMIAFVAAMVAIYVLKSMFASMRG